ncbi:MAG: C13 family peptidase [Pseudomonadota bacterium]
MDEPQVPLDVQESFEPSTPVPDAALRPSLWGTMLEGARTLVFMRPRWQRIKASAAIIALLVALEIALTMLFQRMYVSGPASFHAEALGSGWIGLMLYAWACYALRPPQANTPANAPSTAQLLVLVLAQSLCLLLVVGPLYAVLLRTNALANLPNWIPLTIWLAPIAWGTLAALRALLWAPGALPLGRLAAFVAIALGVAAHVMIAPNPYWTVAAAGQAQPDEESEPALRFTQEIVEEQEPLLDAQLAALAPQRPGVIDMYTITFAPYEGEEVFRRESRMVSEVMAKRFKAAGRGVQLLNHREHLTDIGWATPLNLQRAISSIAETMDRNEDVLFVHLTSHGASNGELAANFWPLDVDPVMPTDLRQWLDEAGIRYRVLSISACYSGSWIAPLASDDTLVMTASDATHTSYGCGRKSDLTFFGRAVFDEQIRSKTLSFEQAHAAARIVIKKRELEAGKDDGYSNPQIKVGSRIGPYLKQLEAAVQ